MCYDVPAKRTKYYDSYNPNRDHKDRDHKKDHKKDHRSKSDHKSDPHKKDHKRDHKSDRKSDHKSERKSDHKSEKKIEKIEKKEKSLGRLSQKFIQLFLVGNEVLSLNDAASKLLGGEFNTVEEEEGELSLLIFQKS